MGFFKRRLLNPVPLPAKDLAEQVPGPDSDAKETWTVSLSSPSLDGSRPNVEEFGEFVLRDAAIEPEREALEIDAYRCFFLDGIVHCVPLSPQRGMWQLMDYRPNLFQILLESAGRSVATPELRLITRPAPLSARNKEPTRSDPRRERGSKVV